MDTKCTCNQIAFHISICHLILIRHLCNSPTNSITHKYHSTSHLMPWLFLMVGTRHTHQKEKSTMSTIKLAQQAGYIHQPHHIINTLTHMLAYLVPWVEEQHLFTLTNMVLDCISKRCNEDNSSTLTCTVKTNNSI